MRVFLADTGDHTCLGIGAAGLARRMSMPVAELWAANRDGTLRVANLRAPGRTPHEPAMHFHFACRRSSCEVTIGLRRRRVH